MRTQFWGALVCLFCFQPGAHAQSDLQRAQNLATCLTGRSPTECNGPDQALSEWIGQNIRFEKNQDNKDTLYIRKNPVTAFVASKDAAVGILAQSVIANFADAFGLEYGFGNSDVNMIVATSDAIAERGKPNKKVIMKFGFSEEAADYVSNISGDWSSGCGFYSSRTEEGRVSISLILADHSLSSQKQSLCIITGIIFGFGMRSANRAILDHQSEHVRYLSLARSLTKCDKSLAASSLERMGSVREAFVRCAAEGLSAVPKN